MRIKGLFNTLALSFTVILLSDRLTAETPEGRTTSVYVPTIETGLYKLPSRADIESIKAELYRINDLGSIRPSVDAFVVPDSHVERVLRFFDSPAIDRSPRLQWPEAGSIKITEKDGNVIRIGYYTRIGKGPLAYSIHGVRCYDEDSDVGDNAARIDLLLRDAYQSVTGHITTHPLAIGEENSTARTPPHDSKK